MTESHDAPAVLVDRFLTHLRVERGLSPQTLRAYSADLARFIEWCERSDADPLTLTPVAMRRYLAEMDRAAYSRRTIARRLSAVRSLFAFLQREGLTALDPAAVVATPRLPSRLPRIVPTDILTALLEAPDSETPAGLRDGAVLELLYATGARVSEVSSLRVGDVDFGAGQVRVMGKGSKERVLPLHPTALRRLDSYLTRGRPRLAGDRSSPALFLNRSGTVFSDGGIRRMLKRYIAEVGGTSG